MSALLKPLGPIGFPFLGMLPAFRRDPTGFLLGVAAKYGDISYFRLGPLHTYLVNRPDLIQEILVTSQSNFTKSRILQRSKALLGEGLLTSEGAFHLRQRRLAQPAFHRDRLAHYGQQMIECAAEGQTRWTDGETRDIAEEMARITLNIVTRTLFSVNVDAESAAIGEAVTRVLNTFQRLLSPFQKVTSKLPLPSNISAARAQRFLDATIYGFINDRRRSGKDHGDLLSMLLLSVDEESGSMTDKQVRDEALTIFLAGHETTATALTWTWYLLSQHPDVEARMRKEIDEVLGGRTPTVDDVSALRYTEMVLAESMRLYPPAWSIGRMVKNSYRLFNHELAPGSILVMSPYVMHRHPRYYPDPERFDPERFSAEKRQERPKFAYFPFGGGARVCIGERFAMMEGVLVLATLAQNWKLRLVPGHPVATLPQITLRTRYGMKMTLERVTRESK